jgi:hypothetical protein
VRSACGAGRGDGGEVGGGGGGLVVAWVPPPFRSAGYFGEARALEEEFVPGSWRGGGGRREAHTPTRTRTDTRGVVGKAGGGGFNGGHNGATGMD